MMRLSLQVVFFLFYCLGAHGYSGPNVINTRILDDAAENEWVLIDDDNYIPYLNFSKVEYKNIKDIKPHISVFLDTSNNTYQEHYHLMIDNLILRLKLTYYEKNKNLSIKDKYENLEDSISWALKDADTQTVIDMSQKTVGLNNQDLAIDYFHWGKFIQTNKERKKDKYCVSFYYWTGKKSNNEYETLVNSLWCNANVQEGGELFNSYKDINDFIKNTEFNNQTRLKRLYEDEKTKLLRLQEEKRLIEEQKKEKEKKLANAIELINDKILGIKTAINNLKKRINDEIVRIDKFINNIDPNLTYSISFEGIEDEILDEKKNIEILIAELQDLIKKLPKDYDTLDYDDERINVKRDLKDIDTDALTKKIITAKSKLKDLAEERHQKAAEEKKREEERIAEEKKILKNSRSLLSTQEDSVQTLHSLIKQINKRIELIEKDDFGIDILEIQQKDRQDISDTFISKINAFNKDHSQIQKYNEEYNVVAIKDILKEFNVLNETIQDLRIEFDASNVNLKDIINEKIQVKIEQKNQKDVLIYLLLAVIIILIAILIIVFIYFIRSNRAKIDFEHKQNDKDPGPKKEEIPSEIKLRKPDKVKIDENKIMEKKKEVVDADIKEEKKEEIVVLEKEKEITKEKIDAPSSQSLDNNEIIIKEYLDIITHPKNIKQFKDKWNVQPLERMSPLSQKEEIKLETSKKILERSPFWLIRDKDDSSLFYVLPGTMLWSRIQEILEDNSRFGYMNFNGIYSIKESKKHEIKTLANATKDENGELNIVTIGDIEILKVI